MVRLFNLILAGVSVTRLGLTRPGDAGARAGEVLAGAGATFSIFFGFRSRTLMFFFFLSCMFVTCPSLDLCGTEQQLMLARFVLYLESGHPDESIYLSCAWAFDFLTLLRAHSFVFRFSHFGFFCFQFPPSLKKSHQTISCRCLVLKREGLMPCSLPKN